MLENAQSDWLTLDGEWSVTTDIGFRHIYVPSEWESHNSHKSYEGPVLYSRHFQLPAGWQEGRMMLEAYAISFAATVLINGQRAGSHTGMWSPFQLDVTSLLHDGENKIEIEVWKPGSQYPVRECLAGFLPDVAAPFGGIWQSIGLRLLCHAAVQDVRVSTDAAGHVQVSGMIHVLNAATELRGRLEVIDGSMCVAQAEITVTPSNSQRTFSAQCQVAQPRLWDVDGGPALYDIRLTWFQGDVTQPCMQVMRRVGFRKAQADGDRLLLNGQPLHVRGVLDWGWDAQRICPTPTRQQVLDQIAKARALGFNMIKLCLFVPDEITFEVADEEGVLLWLELPMWLPKVTPAFRELALREYAAILQRVHHHPSIVIASLGCELNADAGADFLHALNELARAWLPNTLLCDNSGSAEAYGGVVTGLNDFYDYHFYTDPHFFESLVDHFTRSYRPAKPWIYGEFCDADTLRDFSSLQPRPWWLAELLPTAHPDSAPMQDYEQRLDTAGVADGGKALTTTARQQATALRKFIFEHVRRRAATGGYVITGWKDTPISTSGVVDDRNELKYSPDEWQQFNNDCVLVIDRERRRKWQHGGDRPVYSDPYTWWQGETAEIHLALSNGKGQINGGMLRWTFGATDTPASSSGERPLPALPGGEVTELHVLHLPMLAVGNPTAREFILQVGADLAFVNGATQQVTNAWRMWAMPDQQGCLNAVTQTSIAYALNDELLARVQNGASAVLWLTQPDERLTMHMPFWREAIHIFKPHPFWDAVPHPGYADMRFFSVATDFALEPDALTAWLSEHAAGTDTHVIPVWRRFDARKMTWADYVVEARIGAGRLFISTLRFAGGLGYQPNSFETNPIGAWMLRSLLQ